MEHRNTPQIALLSGNTVANADAEALRLLLQAALNALPPAKQPAPVAAADTMPDEWALLDPEQQTMVKLIAEGETTATLAKKQHLSPHTIHSRRATICRILKLSGSDCLLRFAERHGAWLLQTPPA